MTKVNDITLGQLAGGGKRYWPFLTILLAVLLVGTILPPADGGDGADRLAVDAGLDAGAMAGRDGTAAPPVDSDIRGDASLGGTTGGLAASSGGAASPGSAVGAGAASTPGATPSRTATGVGAAPAASTGGVRWPGVGTEAALSAPDCDRATGRLKIPTPFSPPCVPIWPAGADNGGATSQGVTSKEIVLVVRRGKPSPEGDAAARALGIYDDPDTFKKYLQGYLDIFNKYAETYGRKVKLIQFIGSGTGEAAERADAIKAVQQYKPFAALGLANGNTTWANEMAARGVMTWGWYSGSYESFQKKSPYLWSVMNAYPEGDYLALAELIGKSLAGRPAKWSGDLLARGQQRKFGLIYDDFEQVRGGVQVFEQALAKRGVTLAAKVGMPADIGQAGSYAQTAIAKMKSAGVNTLVSTSNFVSMAVLTKQATSQNYFPEWLVNDVGYNTFALLVRTYDPAQTKALYALSTNPVPLPKGLNDHARVYVWEHGPQPTTPPGSFSDFAYGDLLMFDFAWQFFGGIQLAGPQLTPQTLHGGLFALPASGGAPMGGVTIGLKSFGNKGYWPWPDYATRDDYALLWYDPSGVDSTTSGDTKPGIFYTAGMGKRYVAGQLPEGDVLLFDRGSSVSSLQTPPANEVRGPYPANRTVRNK